MGGQVVTETTHCELADRGVRVLREQRQEPLGPDEKRIADPEGVERRCRVPEEHSLCRRVPDS